MVAYGSHIRAQRPPMQADIQPEPEPEPEPEPSSDIQQLCKVR